MPCLKAGTRVLKKASCTAAAALMRSGNATNDCRLRFVNSSSEPLRVLWINYAGDEQQYACIQPGSQHIQGRCHTAASCSINATQVQPGPVLFPCSYLHHTPLEGTGLRVGQGLRGVLWRRRSAGAEGGGPAGCSVTVIVSGRGVARVRPGVALLQVHPWPSRHICARSAPWPAHWGQYCQRGEALGIPIMVSKLHLQLLQQPTAAALKGWSRSALQTQPSKVWL